ncbi:MAG: GNAT family N-acetyltransferase [Lachnospiraceae bacterium]|nr:GNAT family N-acetyltransferase [Lachnospiraceae bacterium]
MFYQYCPPFVTRDSIRSDLKALPPNTSYENKYYMGFFHEGNLVAIMDLILGYPNQNTAFIGLFMVSKSEQGKGVGTDIISECAGFLKEKHYTRIRLAFAEGNQQSEMFWKKNKFMKTGEISDKGEYTAVLMERKL